MEDTTQEGTQVPVKPGILIIITLPDPEVVVSPLPERIIVQRNDLVQWRYDEDFFVCITPGLFDKDRFFSTKQSDGSFLTGEAKVTGAVDTLGTCTYKLVPLPGTNAVARNPPPPNDLIIDSSTPSLLAELQQELIEEIRTIEDDSAKLELLINAVILVLSPPPGLGE